MNKSVFGKTLSGHRELTLDRLNFAQHGQLQVENEFPLSEQVVVADITTTPPSTQYKTLTPSMVGIQDLTAGTNITYSAGTTYNGSVAITINSTDTNTEYTGVDPVDISAGNVISVKYDDDTIVLDGGELAVDHTNGDLTFTGYDTGTFDGSSNLTINLVDTDTTYTAGDNLDLTGTEFSLDTSIDEMRDIAYESGFFATTLLGNDYPGSLTTATYLDLSSTTNLILPHNCFYDSILKEYQLAFNPGIFMPNDDQSYFNIAVEDDSATATHGRVKPLTASLELVGFITIPSGWRATKGLLSLVNSLGSNVSRTTQFQNVQTWGGTGYITLGFGSTNSALTFGTPMTGGVSRTLMLKVYTASTSDFVGGGYITIDKV